MPEMRIPRDAPLEGDVLVQWRGYVDLAHKGLRAEAFVALRLLADCMTVEEAERLTDWFCRRYFKASDGCGVGMNAVMAERVLVPALQRRAAAGDRTGLLWLALLARDPSAHAGRCLPQLRQRSWWVGLQALALLRNPQCPSIWRRLYNDEIYEAWYGTHHLLSDEALVLPEETCWLALERARIIEARALAGALPDADLRERREIEGLLTAFVSWRAARRPGSFCAWLDDRRAGRTGT